MKIFENVKERAVLAYITVILTFAVIFRIMSDNKITVEEMGVITAVVGIAGFVYGYYFGTSKNETERQKTDADGPQPVTKNIEKVENINVEVKEQK